MEPHELRTVHYKMTYHQHCFLLFIREKARNGAARWPTAAQPDGASKGGPN
jgi:hypothetical protein